MSILISPSLIADITLMGGGYGWQGELHGLECSEGKLYIPAQSNGLREGEFISIPYCVSLFDTLVPTWSAYIPSQTTLKVEIRVAVGEKWEQWCPLSIISQGESRSFGSYKNGICQVDIDTLKIIHPNQSSMFQCRFSMTTGGKDSPILYTTSITHYMRGKHRPLAYTSSPAWGKIIDFPQRSQTTCDPSIAGSICSPTCIAMMLEYFKIHLTTEEVARGVFDSHANIYGNWSFNTAYAAFRCQKNLERVVVAKLYSIEELENEIQKGCPIVISHKWSKGELHNAPVSSSDGHLVVVIGFTPTGDIVINDPAAKVRNKDPIQRVYARNEIYKTWLINADGIAYIIIPR